MQAKKYYKCGNQHKTLMHVHMLQCYVFLTGELSLFIHALQPFTEFGTLVNNTWLG